MEHGKPHSYPKCRCDLCREAYNAYMRDYFKRHPEKRAAYRRKWRAENPEKDRELRRRWRQTPNGRAVEARRDAARKAARWEGFVPGERACAECGGHFSVDEPSLRFKQYCSTRCGDRAAKRRRTYLERGAARTEPYRRQEIYERDGRKCHICGKVVTQKDFTIDHLVPLVDGGADSAENVATAHMLCNSKRREVGPAQLRLTG